MGEKFIKICLDKDRFSVNKNYYLKNNGNIPNTIKDLSDYNICRYVVTHNHTSTSDPGLVFDLVSPFRINTYDIEYWIISYKLLNEIKNFGSVDKFIEDNKNSLSFIVPRNIQYKEYVDILKKLIRHSSLESIFNENEN